jgi:hypothetical protein
MRDCDCDDVLGIPGKSATGEDSLAELMERGGSGGRQLAA